MRYTCENILLLLLAATLTGCGEQPAETDIQQPESSVAVVETESVAIDDNETLTTRQMQMWSGSCALCHVNGNAGAPVVGIAQHWQPRVAKGMETLLQHTVEGFNSMPPLGYCMACEMADFSAMIHFMSKNHSASGAATLVGETAVVGESE